MPSAENANGRSGRPWPRQQPAVLAVAAAFRRILRIERRLHEPKDRGRKRLLQRAARAIDQEDVMALLDPRRRQEHLPQHAEPDRAAAASHASSGSSTDADEDQHGRNDEQRVAEQVIDRQADAGDDERKRRQPAPDGRRPAFG